jgi:anti-anti-sigma factor
MYLAITTRPEGILIQAEGVLDRYYAEELRVELSRQAVQGIRVVVDLSQMVGEDAKGAAILISALKNLRKRQADLHLVYTPTCRRIAEITGLNRIIQIHDTVASAFGAP